MPIRKLAASSGRSILRAEGLVLCGAEHFGRARCLHHRAAVQVDVLLTSELVPRIVTANSGDQGPNDGGDADLVVSEASRLLILELAKPVEPIVGLNVHVERESGKERVLERVDLMERHVGNGGERGVAERVVIEMLESKEKVRIKAISDCRRYEYLTLLATTRADRSSLNGALVLRRALCDAAGG